MQWYKGPTATGEMDLKLTLKAAERSMLERTSGLLLVPITISLRPGGGILFTSTSKVWRTELEKRGPIATYSRRRSRSSRTIIDLGDCKRRQDGDKRDRKCLKDMPRYAKGWVRRCLLSQMKGGGESPDLVGVVEHLGDLLALCCLGETDHVIR